MNKKQKQWEEKVAEFHSSILARLKYGEHVSIPQYKDLYFRIFQEAYESGFCGPLSYNLIYAGEGIRVEWIHTKPMVSGDSIWLYALQQGWCHAEMHGDDHRYQQIHTVMTWWDEWTYAWRNLRDRNYFCGYKTRCHRGVEQGS